MELDLEGFALTVAGHDVPLTRAEFLLLAELARRPFHVLDRDSLATALQCGEPGVGPSHASERAMDTHIARLRRKLRAAGVDCIKTMRYVGYRFVPAESGKAVSAGR